MNDTATETRTVAVEREIAFPPEKIWRALTQPRYRFARPIRRRPCHARPVRDPRSRAGDGGIIAWAGGA